MKRALAAALLVVGLMGASALPASAAGTPKSPTKSEAKPTTNGGCTSRDPSTPRKGATCTTGAALPTGPVSGTESFEFQTNGCAFVFEQISLTISGTTPGTLNLEGCVDSAELGFTFDGSFVLTDANGTTFTGTATGTVFRFEEVPLDLTLTVVSTTSDDKSTVGSQLSLTSPDFQPGEPGAISTLTGTLAKI